jgi:hypothetical protein
MLLKSIFNVLGSPEPAFVDRSLDAGAKLLARATGMSEIAI